APNWIIQKITLLLPQNSLLNGYLLGIILGFLPCGLVYAAIIAVAATSDILLAFLGMAAFALGTMPVLMIISASGKMLLNKKYSWLKPASAILMAFNGVMLFIMAGKWFV
ncbi:MAG: sulfite exporter TauE/SafE family protein, partial [Pseudomonadota bacterium]